MMEEGDNIFYMRARFYDAESGRFLNEDLIGFDGGDLNLYAYAEGNPLGQIDPSGLYPSEFSLDLNEDYRTAGSTKQIGTTKDENIISDALYIWGSCVAEEVSNPFSEGKYLTGTMGIIPNFVKGSLYSPWSAALQYGAITDDEYEIVKNPYAMGVDLYFAGSSFQSAYMGPYKLITSHQTISTSQVLITMGVATYDKIDGAHSASTGIGEIMTLMENLQ